MAISDGLICWDYATKGLSCREIAQIDGRSETTIYYRLKSCGVTLRSRSAANKKFSDAVVKALYNLSLSCAQIGTLLGVHPTTVVKRLQACGFPMRPHETAIAVGYTDKEFRRYFLNHRVLDVLAEVA